jgi:hypothetical protein
MLAVVDEPHAITDRREDLSSHQTGTADIFAILALEALLEVAVAVHFAIMIAIALVLARFDPSRANHTRVGNSGRLEFEGGLVD